MEVLALSEIIKVTGSESLWIHTPDPKKQGETQRDCFLPIFCMKPVSGSRTRIPGVSANKPPQQRAFLARRHTVDQLVHLNECFLQFSNAPEENINRLTAFAGEVMLADCALYNRLQGGLLCSLGQWKTPAGYQSQDAPEGHICYDVIQRGKGTPLVIRHLQTSPYAASDPNVRQYGLNTYIGVAVRWGQQAIGSLCVVYQTDRQPDSQDLHLLQLIAAAIGVEEERKEALQALQASLHEKEALLKEIHHRVKNNLQVISSLLNLQAGQVKEPAALEVLQDSQHRIKSMALVHERLYLSPDLAQIPFSVYVRDLADFLLRSYHLQPITCSIHIDDEVFLEIEKAIPCGLILNELITNALKHAFPQQESGQIQITCTHRPDNLLRLCVADDGIGLPAGFSFEQTGSLGMQLVTSLAEQIDGKIDWQSVPDLAVGTCITITFPRGSYGAHSDR